MSHSVAPRAKMVPQKLLCICIALVLISCIGASILQTSFGGVEITKFKVPTDKGKWVSGYLYKPAAATAEAPVPLVITSHGYLNNHQMQDSTSIELSRRGIAVMEMDAYFHGDSSPSDQTLFPSIMDEATGMIPLVEYAYYNLDYIDNHRIGVTGHSMGGMNSWATIAHYGRQYYAYLDQAAQPDSDGGTEITEAEQREADALNKVTAAFPVSQIAEQYFAIAMEGEDQLVEDLYRSISANIGINLGYYDENGYTLTRGTADLSGDAPESLSFINHVLGSGEQVSSVELEHYYGSAADRTLRVIYNPKEIHPWQHFSKTSAAYMVEFFTAAFQMENPIPLGNQLWFLKELFNLIGLVAAFLAIVPIGRLLLEIPFFSPLKKAEPPRLPALDSPRSKVRFWGAWCLCWIVSAVSYMPVSQLDRYIFPTTFGFGLASAFPQPVTNYIMLWSVFNGLFGLLLFYVMGRLNKGATPDISQCWGIKISARELAKTLLLAVCILIGFYGFVMFADYFFLTDFRIWTFAIRAFTADKLSYLLQYLPFFFIFYLANSILINSANRVAGQKEWFNLLICGVGNSLGLVLLFAIQYIGVYQTGVSPWVGEWIRPLVLFPLIFLLFIAAYISRRLFQATGTVWLGATVNSLVIVMISVANTASFQAI